MKKRWLSTFACAGALALAVAVCSPAAFAEGNSNARPEAELGLTTQADTPVTTGGAVNIEKAVYTLNAGTRNGAVLDVAGGSTANSAPTQIYSANSTPAQRWRVEPAGGDYYRIVAVESGKVLDVRGGGKANGTVVQQYQWNGTNAQKWKFVKDKLGGYTVVSALSDNLALDISGASTLNGAKVQIWTKNGTKAQSWKLGKITPALGNGIYTLKSKIGGKALDASGGNIVNGTNLQQYAANNTMAQFYQLSYDANTGYYRVVNALSGLSIDVAGGQSKNGANINLYSANSTRAQKWHITSNGDGSYTFRSAIDGRVMDVSGGSNGNGANVQTWGSNSTNAQKWTASKVANWVPDGVYNIVTANNTNNALAYQGGNGGNVQSAGRNDGDFAQCWVVKQVGGTGYYTIRNVGSRLAAGVAGNNTANSTNVNQYGYDKKDGQLWKPVLTANGIVWHAKLNDGAVLDMRNGGTGAGTKAQVFQGNNTAAQKFRLHGVSPVGFLPGNAYIVRNVASGKVLDVSGASAANGAAVQLYASNNTYAQRFTFAGKGGATFAFVNGNSNKAIDVDTNTKTKIQQWGNGNDPSQKWTVAFDLENAAFTIKSNYTGKFLDGTSGTLSLKNQANSSSQWFTLTPTTVSYFRVFLNSGHNWGNRGAGRYDPGAGGNGYTEAALVSELSDKVIAIGRNNYGLDIIDSRPYQLYFSHRLPKAIELGCSVIFSIHFDAGGGSGPLTMVGVSGRHPQSLTFNDIMQRHLNNALPGLRHRGTSYRNDIMCVNGNIPAVLAEVCFVDNAYDMRYYQAHKDDVARELAAGLYEASQVQALRKR